MFYRDFQGKQISALGFGCMRLPLRADRSIDEEQVYAMVDYALENGVNYFDTAYPYHESLSEVVVGKALSRHPRSSFYLATKYPGHQIASSYDPKSVFEEQLEKCGVDYFDFYLLHNVCESSIDVYLDPKWGIIDYFLEQKRLGRIHHLGFSCHARLDTMELFLNKHGQDMEFCQIQLNYLDWTLQDAKTKVELLDRYHIPVWVMEPVRGGRLANLTEEQAGLLYALRQETPAAWAFRFLQGIPQVTVTLSGMSNLEQMQQNIATYEQCLPLTSEQENALLRMADEMKNAVPCTACRYCIKTCPMGLEIPMLIAGYNDARFGGGFTVGMAMDALPEEKRPSACLGCGVCARNCPQGIDIPKIMQDFAASLEKAPHWADICKAREEAAKKLKQK